MSRNDNYRRSNKNKSNWNKNSSGQKSFESKNHSLEVKKSVYAAEQKKAQIAQENAIKNFKSNSVNCAVCGLVINDLSSALKDKLSDKPVHFDCVLQELAKKENLSSNEKITYIGNGKFAVLHFDNVHDMRHFSIVKEFQWENKEEQRGEWRDKMSNLYSQVN